MLIPAADYVDDEEEGLQFGLQEGEEYEYLAEDADCAEGGLVLVEVEGEQVEVYEEEEHAGHDGYDDQICLRF